MVELVEQMLAARKQLAGAQSDKDKDFYTNRCDGLDRQIDAAEKLGRDWIGIDVTQLAISLIKNRLLDTYGRRMQFVSGPEGRDASPRRPGSGHVADVSGSGGDGTKSVGRVERSVAMITHHRVIASFRSSGMVFLRLVVPRWPHEDDPLYRRPATARRYASRYCPAARRHEKSCRIPTA